MITGRHGFRRRRQGDTAVQLAPSVGPLAAATCIAVLAFASEVKAEEPNGSVLGISVSADGALVAFDSTATNLDIEDADPARDVYVRNMASGVTELISRGGGATAPDANGFAYSPSISADGHFVAFESMATNLSPGDTDAGRDVYVRDLTTDETILVSRASGADGIKADGESFRPSISADGRYVAFVSLATNLAAGDPDDQLDIFVRDLGSNTTTLVSRADGASGSKANAASVDPVISGNGMAVAFTSAATNLDSADQLSDDDVYVRYLATSGTELASRDDGVGGDKALGGGSHPSISADGTLVAFGTYASNLPDDGDETQSDVYLRDVAAGTTELVSRANGAEGDDADDWSDHPSISSDGTRVSFLSLARNLSPAATNGKQQAYVRDRVADTTTLASRADGKDGPAAATSEIQAVGRLAMSAGGDHLAFISRASNLDADPAGLEVHAYLRHLSADDSAVIDVGPGTFDTDPPAASITSGPDIDEVIHDPTPTFTFIADEPGSFECRLEDFQIPDFNECASPTTFGPLEPGEGPRVFVLRAVDVRGNVGPYIYRGFRYSPARCAGHKGTLVGGDEGGDTLVGGGGADVVAGLAGGDDLSGRAEADRLCGGDGDDQVTGGGRADVLVGNSGDDHLKGGKGIDKLRGGPGVDVCRGGGGENIFRGCEFERGRGTR